MRLSTILELAQRHGIPLPASTLDGLRPHLQAMVPQPGLMAFIEKIDRSIRVLVDVDACRRVAYECVEDAAGEGIDYVEVRFSPRYMAGPHGLDPADVVAAVVDGTHAAARDHAIGANLIGILSRTYGPEACWEEFEALRRYHEHITAMDIAGDEAAWPAELFADHFRAGRDLGWHITAHAGEAAGPESIRIAIQQLGATRIGHGLHAIDDAALMDTMAERHYRARGQPHQQRADQRRARLRRPPHQSLRRTRDTGHPQHRRPRRKPDHASPRVRRRRARGRSHPRADPSNPA